MTESSPFMVKVAEQCLVAMDTALSDGTARVSGAASGRGVTEVIDTTELISFVPVPGAVAYKVTDAMVAEAEKAVSRLELLPERSSRPAYFAAVYRAMRGVASGDWDRDETASSDARIAALEADVNRANDFRAILIFGQCDHIAVEDGTITEGMLKGMGWVRLEQPACWIAQSGNVFDELRSARNEAKRLKNQPVSTAAALDEVCRVLAGGPLPRVTLNRLEQALRRAKADAMLRRTTDKSR